MESISPEVCGENELEQIEPSEVAFQLLADWWMNSVQALVDSVGSAKALDLLRPHFRNAAVAGALIVNETFCLNQIDLATHSACLKMMYVFATRGKADIQVEVRELGCVFHNNKCIFKDSPPELCELSCDTVPNAIIGSYDSGYEWILMSRMSQGASECRKVLKPKSWFGAIDLERLGTVKAEVLTRKIPLNILDDFSIQYLAEFWVMTTRGFIDNFGSQPSLILMEIYSSSTLFIRL